jgi:hypothetical protein
MSWRLTTLLGYGLVTLAGGIVEMAGRRGATSIPTLDQTLRWVLQTRSGRIAIFAAWAWMGLHFLG